MRGVGKQYLACAYQNPHPPCSCYTSAPPNPRTHAMLTLTVRCLLAGLQGRRSLILKEFFLRHQAQVLQRGGWHFRLYDRQSALEITGDVVSSCARSRGREE
jgi:hypothetical protein